MDPVIIVILLMVAGICVAAFLVFVNDLLEYLNLHQRLKEERRRSAKEK